MKHGRFLKVVAILLKVSVINISATQSKLDEDELEKLLEGSSWNVPLYKKAARIEADSLEPNIAQVIKHVQYFAFEGDVGYSCEDDEIKKMSDFHNLMLDQSERYRNIDETSKIIRSFIRNHWSYVSKCLNKEAEHLRSRLAEEKWQLLSGKMKKFWRITSTKGDTYLLNIVSDLVAKKRKIRDAKESPEDWARLIYSLIAEGHKDSSYHSQTIDASNIHDMLKKSMIVHETEYIKYPNEGYIGNLYDRLISEQCKAFQGDQLLVKSLGKAARLAGVTQWPRLWKEDDRIFDTELHESTLEYLTLGFIVCNQLDGHFRKEAIENGVSIVQALNESAVPSDNGWLDEMEIEKMMGLKKFGTTLSDSVYGITTDLLDPEIAYVIRFAKSSRVLEDLRKSCPYDTVESVKKFHNYMMERSRRYRKVQDEFNSVRLIINFNWQFATKCLTKEAEKLPEKWQSYASGLEIKFREIARIPGDVFYLDIASDLIAGKRKIRGPRENPKKWAEIFEESFEKILDPDASQDKFDRLLQPEIEVDVYDSFSRETHLNEITGERLPREGFIEKLYNLVLEQCIMFHEDQILVKSLEDAKNLAKVTHWPKSYDLTGELFGRKFDESILGPLTLRSVVCSHLNDHFREEAINNGVLITDESMNRSHRNELDENQLEDLLGSGLKRGYQIRPRAKLIPTAHLEPNLSQIIEEARISPIFVIPFKPDCTDEEMEIMGRIHNFMLRKSERYRYDDVTTFFFRMLIDGHWKYLTKCIEIEAEILKEKLLQPKWQSIAKLVPEFWKVTSIRRDIYFLGIVSDLSAGRRRIRDARESPRDWAKMFEGLLFQNLIESFGRRGASQQQDFQKLAITEFNNLVKKEINFDEVTGLKYPRRGYIGELYDRLIVDLCGTFDNNREQRFRHSLEKVVTLSGLSKWPEKGRNRRVIFNFKGTSFDESLIGPLTFGLLVCKHLNNRYRDAAVDNEIAIFDALTEGIDEPNLTDAGPSLSQLESMTAIREESQNLVSILEVARTRLHDHGLELFKNQMARLELVAKRAPQSFLCEDVEIERIAAVSKSIIRLRLANTNDVNCCTHLDKYVAQLKEQFVDTCLRSAIASLVTLVDEETKLQVLKMPRFWRILGYLSAPPLKDCLVYAGSIFNGSVKILDSSQSELEWKDVLRESAKDLFRVPPNYLPAGLKQYWRQAQEQLRDQLNIGIRTEGRFTVSQKTIYNDLIIGWCENFEPRDVHLQSKYSKEVTRLVQVAGSLLRFEKYGEEYFSNLEVNSEVAFLLGQSTLGYSVCMHLDPTTNLSSSIYFSDARTRPEPKTKRGTSKQKKAWR